MIIDLVSLYLEMVTLIAFPCCFEQGHVLDMEGSFPRDGKTPAVLESEDLVLKPALLLTVSLTFGKSPPPP